MAATKPQSRRLELLRILVAVYLRVEASLEVFMTPCCLQMLRKTDLENLTKPKFRLESLH